MQFDDNQIWENEKYVLKVEKLLEPDISSRFPTIRAVIFTKTEDQGLRFLEFVWKDEIYLTKLVATLGLTLTQKKLVLE